MAYDEDLAERIRATLPPDLGHVDERRMFGGLAFLVGGHLAVTASGRGGLMVRCDPGESEGLLRESGVQPMVMRGRELAGWLLVDAAHVATDDQVATWVEIGTSYARALPPRSPRTSP